MFILASVIFLIVKMKQPPEHNLVCVLSYTMPLSVVWPRLDLTRSPQHKP